MTLCPEMASSSSFWIFHWKKYLEFYILAWLVISTLISVFTIKIGKISVLCLCCDEIWLLWGISHVWILICNTIVIRYCNGMTYHTVNSFSRSTTPHFHFWPQGACISGSGTIGWSHQVFLHIHDTASSSSVTRCTLWFWPYYMSWAHSITTPCTCVNNTSCKQPKVVLELEIQAPRGKGSAEWLTLERLAVWGKVTVNFSN